MLVSKFKKFVREFACACRNEGVELFLRYTEKDGKTDVNSSLRLSAIIMRCIHDARLSYRDQFKQNIEKGDYRLEAAGFVDS